MELNTKCDFAGMTIELGSHSEKEQQMFPPASIQSLPEEVLCHIFSYLTLRELCNTVQKVCKQWERLHWDPQLYRLPSKRATRKIFKCLNDRPTPYLASPDFDEKYIKKTVKAFLKVYKKPTGDDKVDKLFYKELIIMLAHLTKVHLKTTPKFPGSLSHLLRFCHQLEELATTTDDNLCDVDDAELAASCDQLRGTLRVLHLGCRRWTVAGGKAVSKCVHLEDLTIESYIAYLYTFTSGHSLKGCLREIENMSSLRRLRFQCCSFETDRPWISMFSNDALKDLTSLHLQYCNFNDSVAVAIGANLKYLTELYLQPINPNVFNVTCQGLVAIIKGCKKMTKLEVQCQARQSIVRAIMLIPVYLPGLKELAVVFRHLAGINWKTPLKKEMPGLVIRGKFSEIPFTPRQVESCRI